LYAAHKSVYESLDKLDAEAKKKKIEMEKMAAWKADQAKRQAKIVKDLPSLPAKDVVPKVPEVNNTDSYPLPLLPSSNSLSLSPTTLALLPTSNSLNLSSTDTENQ
jgi:hypothetical protein